MAKDINTLISEADEIIAKNSPDGMRKTASKEDDIFALAEQVKSAYALPEKPAIDETSIKTLQEKVASSMAIVDTILNLPVLTQLAEFEKAAMDSGKKPEQIQQFIEKTGAAKKIKSIRGPLMKVLALGGAGGAGAALGHKKGEREGYSDAIEDVDTVMRQMNL